MICPDLSSLAFLIGSSLFLTVVVMDLRSASDVVSWVLIQESVTHQSVWQWNDV